MTDIDALVEGAVDKGSFDVLDTLAGVAYPSDKVTIYIDAESAWQVARLAELAADTLDPDEADELDAKMTALKERIKESALTFHMRGYPYEVSQNIEKEARGLFKLEATAPLSFEAQRWFQHKAIAEAIQRVEKASGEVDGKRWTPESVEALRNRLVPGEFAKLDALVSRLAFAATYFDAVVDADF